MTLCACIASICLMNTAFSSDRSVKSKSTVPAQFKTVNESIQTELTAHTVRLFNQQKALIQTKAVIAITKTKEALVLMENNNIAIAKESLDNALTSLQQLKDQHPALGNVPVRVSKQVNDNLKSFDAINHKKEQINTQLSQNRIQRLRRLLHHFGSEAVISTQSISIEDFLRKLQQVNQLMNQGNSDDARLIVQQLLQSIKQVDYTIPLPLFRAELMIKKAEQLAQETDSNKHFTKAQMKWFLKSAEYQLRIGEALGYGREERYLFLYQVVEGLNNLVDADQRTTKLLARLRSVIIVLKNEVIDELS